MQHYINTIPLYPYWLYPFYTHSIPIYHKYTHTIILYSVYICILYICIYTFFYNIAPQRIQLCRSHHGARNLGLDSLDFFHPEEAALSFAQDVTSGGRRRLMQGPMWPSQFTPTMYCAFFFCLRLHQCFTGVDGEMFLKVYPGSSEGFPSWPWSRRQPALIFGGKPSLNGVVS